MTPTIKFVAIFVLVLALIGLGWWLDNRARAQGYAAGAAAVQVKWDVDKAAIMAAAAAAILKAQQDRDEALQANQVIHDTYEAELLAAHTSANSLAQRLREYAANATANSGRVPQADRGPGSPAAGTPSGDDRLTELLGAAFAECTQNADQLDALIAQLKPQL